MSRTGEAKRRRRRPARARAAAALAGRRHVADLVLALAVVACSPGDTVDEAAPPRPTASTPPPAASSIPAAEAGGVPALSTSQATSEPPIRADGTVLGETSMMGTHASINLWVDPGKTPREAGVAIEAAFAEMARLEEIASEWKADSALSRLNRAAGTRPVALPPELLELLTRSKEISQDTGGAFDVTFLGVGRLWSFSPGSHPPDAAAIRRAVELVDYRAIELDSEAGTGLLTRPGMAVGLGAIAKGYIVDAGSHVLVAHGFRNHIVEGGGDTYVAGAKGATPWRVGIKNPTAAGERDNAVGWLVAHDQAVVTSGNYERFFEYEGRRYAHIIDPATGWPIAQETSPRSVTLIAGTAMDADAYCTAITVMGAKAGMEFIEARPDLEGVIITAEGEIRVSSGLAELFVPNPELSSAHPH